MTWLTYDQALAQARSLKRHLEAHGVKVSIELQRGSGNSRHWGHDWFVGELSHHVASKRSQGLTPFLWMIKQGRAGTPFLPPPLSNGYGGFDEVYRIISMGLANHPGPGGPYVLGHTAVPKDQGRYYLWGTEYEGGMDRDDWPPSFRSFMARANAGIIDWLKTLPRGGAVNDRHHLEHSDWAFGRKVDRIGYTREQGIAEIGQARTLVAGTTHIPDEEEDELMAARDDILAEIAAARADLARVHTDVVAARDHANKGKIGVGRLEVAVAGLDVELGEVDVDAVAAAVVDQLPSNLARNLAELIVHRLNESRPADAAGEG